MSMTDDRSPKQQVFVSIDVPKMPNRHVEHWLNSMHRIRIASRVTC